MVCGSTQMHGRQDAFEQYEHMYSYGGQADPSARQSCSVARAAVHLLSDSYTMQASDRLPCQYFW